MEAERPRAKGLAIDDGQQVEVIKDLRIVVPHCHLAHQVLIREAAELGDLAAFLAVQDSGESEP